MVKNEIPATIPTSRVAEIFGWGKCGKLPKPLKKLVDDNGLGPISRTGGTSGTKYKHYPLEKIKAYIALHPDAVRTKEARVEQDKRRSHVTRGMLMAIMKENNALLRALCSEWEIYLDDIMDTVVIEGDACDEPEEKEA